LIKHILNLLKIVSIYLIDFPVLFEKKFNFNILKLLNWVAIKMQFKHRNIIKLMDEKIVYQEKEE
jgi:hypothetical protein